MSMLDVVFSICGIAAQRSLVEAVCKNAWEQRWLLYDNEGIDAVYPMAEWGIRCKLRAVMLQVLSYVYRFSHKRRSF